MKDILEARRKERADLISAAHRYVEDLARSVNVIAASIAGSVARGDFNVWSDIDVVVVADDLPARVPDRMSALMERVHPRVQPVGFTVKEFKEALRKQNALAIEAIERGLPITGDLKALD